MGKAKTRKAIAKRFKFTTDGRVLYLPSGQNHFRAKKSGNIIRAKRKWMELSPAVAKSIKQMAKY